MQGAQQAARIAKHNLWSAQTCSAWGCSVSKCSSQGLGGEFGSAKLLGFLRNCFLLDLTHFSALWEKLWNWSASNLQCYLKVGYSKLDCLEKPFPLCLCHKIISKSSFPTFKRQFWEIIEAFPKAQHCLSVINRFFLPLLLPSALLEPLWFGVMFVFPFASAPARLWNQVSQFPLLDFRLLCRSKIKKLPRPSQRHRGPSKNTHPVGEWRGFKTNGLASPGYLSNVFVGRD